MEQYHKQLKKYYKNKKNKKNDKKTSKKYLDSLFIRIFLSSIILLGVVIISNLYNYQFDFLNKRINFTKIGIDMLAVFNENKINEQILTTSSDYEFHEYNDQINIFKSNTTNSVKCLKSGVVTKIQKHNQVYLITIQTYDGHNYQYDNLTSVDCYLYQYVQLNKIIGVSSSEKGVYKYTLKIYDDKGSYEY